MEDNNQVSSDELYFTQGINACILQQFEIGEQDIRSYSPLTLAYIGDGIYDLIIRSVVVGKCNTQPNRLHHKTTQIVKAETQSKMAEALVEYLTPEELSVYRRGRNAKSYTTAKNASVADYRKATGFEALMGFLYLSNRMDRALELTKKGLQLLEITI